MPEKNIKIWSLTGNHQWLDGGAMFGNVPRVLWQRWYQVDELGRIRLNCRSLLIEIGDQLILCETGIGAYMEPKLRERFGVESSEHILLQSLERLGKSPDDIDYVILSHLHFDHAGGLLPAYKDLIQPLGAEGLLFRRARYVLGREAFERAEKPHPRDRASFIPGLTGALKSSGRLDLIGRGEQLPALSPWIEFYYSDGHTPGQMHTLLRGSRESVFFAGDLIPGTAWVHLPITMGYDRFPEQLIDEKQKLYERCVAEKWLVFLTHDPLVAACKIDCDKESGRFQPMASQREFSGLAL